ncbi:MAG: hypothetical protein WCM76_06370 [Bacteroidota bacterium]
MRTLSVIIFALCVVCCGCKSSVSEQDCQSYDYTDCETTEPVAANLNIRLTINAENPWVPVSIYRGRVEDSVLVKYDSIKEEKYSVLMETGSYYSVVARYISGDKIIYAIGGDKVSKSSQTTCDSICWTVTEGNVNVELKY